VDVITEEGQGDLAKLLVVLRCAAAVGTKGAAVIDAHVRFGVPLLEVLGVSFEGALVSPVPMGGRVAVTVCKGLEFAKAGTGFEVHPLCAL
jgi:hypothetical protein